MSFKWRFWLWVGTIPFILHEVLYFITFAGWKSGKLLEWGFNLGSKANPYDGYHCYDEEVV